MTTPNEEIAALRARWNREWQEFQGRFMAEMDRIDAMIRDTPQPMTDPIDIPVVRIVPRAVPAEILANFERGGVMSQCERLRILMRLRHLETEVASYKEKCRAVAPAKLPAAARVRRRRVMP